MLNRLLITGANGALGAVCRARLAPMAKTLRLSAREGLGEPAPHEEIFYADLADSAAVAAMVEGCDGIVHMGAQALEAPWEVIRPANIDGMVNLFEAARRAAIPPRIFFASSNHTIGFHAQTDRLDANAPLRPDGLYGVSKVFGEALARLYHDKFGIETACVRIGSCYAEPKDHRMLSTWLSYDDLIRLIECVFRAEHLGCPIVYGVSNNDAAWWDNSAVAYLGWDPQDNAEVFRAKIEAEHPRPDPQDAAARYQGGAFCTDPIHAPEH